MTTTLIVDDELDIRILVRVVLELADTGFTVVGEAESGEQALELWRTMRCSPGPDVVVLDNRMPTMTGLEAAERILAECPEQVVVLYSAFLDEEVRAQAEQLGIAACVAKNDLNSLPRVITRTLESRRAS